MWDGNGSTGSSNWLIWLHLNFWNVPPLTSPFQRPRQLIPVFFPLLYQGKGTQSFFVNPEISQLNCNLYTCGSGPSIYKYVPYVLYKYVHVYTCYRFQPAMEQRVVPNLSHNQPSFPNKPHPTSLELEHQKHAPLFRPSPPHRLVEQ